MTIGLMMGYMYKAPLFARFMLFISTIPISIVMNSFRIAVVALFVNHSGIKAAEGFMHYFEGWVIFIICICTLLIEVKIFNRLLGKRESLADSFDYLEAKTNATIKPTKATVYKLPIIVAFSCILITTLSTLTIHHREEVIPPRVTFDQYPLEIADWVGRRHEFQNGENEILKLNDYFLADYNRANTNVGIYLGYTESQRRGFVPSLAQGMHTWRWLGNRRHKTASH